jgi:hypothetical protein
VITAVLDLNHVSKNLGKMLREMSKQWKEISQLVASMLQARFDSTIRHARDDQRDTPQADAVLVLQTRTRAVVNHCFGDHTNCISGKCPAKTDPSYVPTSWPRNKYLEDRAITITVCDAATGAQSTVTISLLAEVRKIFDQYTGIEMCEKLMHNLSSNLPEARHAMMWCMHSSKTTFNPRTLHTQWLSTQLHADLGRNAAVDIVQKSLCIARMRSVVAASRRKADLRAAKVKRHQKTTSAKKNRARQKKGRRARGAAADAGHNKANHLAQDAPAAAAAAVGDAPAAKRPRACCGLCTDELGPPRHKKAACPLIGFDAPKMPALSKFTEPNDIVVFIDVETNTQNNIVEIGAVGAMYSERGNWQELPGEFNTLISIDASDPWPSAQLHHCDHKALREACILSTTTFPEAWEALLMQLRTWKGDARRLWLKAHNGVAVDMRAIVVSAKKAGIEDPLAQLAGVGVVGVIDGKFIIPAHNITSMQHKKSDGSVKPGSYLSNGALYELACGGQEMRSSGLTAHRATDDAKAERYWTTHLPVLTDVMFGEPRRPCGICLDAYRTHHEQYELHQRLDEEKMRLINIANSALSAV